MVLLFNDNFGRNRPPVQLGIFQYFTEMIGRGGYLLCRCFLLRFDFLRVYHFWFYVLNRLDALFHFADLADFFSFFCFHVFQ